MTEAEKTVLMNLLEQAFDHKAWHGTNLKGSIKGLDIQTVSWRPSSGRHNIWEIAVHAAYWKYVVRRRLLTEPAGSFPLNGSNWFPRPVSPGPQEKAWKADVKLLNDSHLRLLEAVAHVKKQSLNFVPPGCKTSSLMLISGIAAHDLYHAGQIQLLKKLCPRKRK
jgi:hypothetical protein